MMTAAFFFNSSVKGDMSTRVHITPIKNNEMIG